MERRWTEKFFVRPSAEEYEAERREQELVLAFEDYLRRLGHEAHRLKIVPPTEHRPIFCDLVDKTANVLVEAKGSVTRENIRMAIGQLYDYRRFAPRDMRLAVLLPERPRQDLQELLVSANVVPLYPEEAGFFDGGLGLADPAGSGGLARPTDRLSSAFRMPRVKRLRAAPPQPPLFRSDSPPVDLEGEKDAFGHKAYATAIASALAEAEPPYTFGLFGPFGLGKTTVIGMV